MIEDSAGDLADLRSAARDAVVAGAPPREELGELLIAIAAAGTVNGALRTAASSLGIANELRPDEVPPAPGTPMATVIEAIDEILALARAAGVIRADVTRMDLTVLLRGVFDIPLDDESRERYVGIILDGPAPHGAAHPAALAG